MEQLCTDFVCLNIYNAAFYESIMNFSVLSFEF